MENKNLIWRNAMNHGLYLGLILIVIDVIVYFFDLMTLSLFSSAIIGAISFLLYFVLILFMTKSYRNNFLGGYISYGNALLYGILVGAFAAIIHAVYSFIFNAFIDPEYMKNMMDKIAMMTEEYMVKHSVPQDVIDQQMNKFQTRELPSPLMAALQSIPSSIIFTAIISLLTSIFVKKKQEFTPEPTSEEPTNEENS